MLVKPLKSELFYVVCTVCYAREQNFAETKCSIFPLYHQDELIKKLQDFKCSQLASLQKFPILDEEGLIERKDEILDESGDLVDKISILQSQR